MLTSGIILAKMNHQLFTQTYINILTPFTNLVHCPQIHLPISKVVDKILAAVLDMKKGLAVHFRTVFIQFAVTKLVAMVS